MAHFSSEIQGSQGGEATRYGNKVSGIQSHIRGSYLGCKVRMYYDGEKQEDVLKIFITSGTHAGQPDFGLLKITQNQWDSLVKNNNFLLPAKIINFREVE